jgi:hypothetical protein
VALNLTKYVFWLQIVRFYLQKHLVTLFLLEASEPLFIFRTLSVFPVRLSVHWLQGVTSQSY